ncbi:MAG: sulfatase [Verrucomicrobiae bacterium]|nr:sulfatase [Verrucomicrobiae bacterium]
MKFRFLLSFLFLGTVLGYAQKNVLLLCIDDLRPELKSFGKDYIHSPNIDKLASQGRPFFRHYVQAPTCGASRYALLTGRYGPGNNNALFDRAERIAKNPDAVVPSMPAWFRQHGYTTVSVGKVSHYPGGRGGPDWNDEAIPEMPDSWDRHLCPEGPWQHPRGIMHGLAHGEIRGDAEEMDVYQSAEGPDTIYPDGLIVEEGLRQMEELAGAGKPFFLAVGIIRPHLPFGSPAKYMEPYKDAELPPTPHPDKPDRRTTWHKSGEFMKYNRWGRDPNEDEEFAIKVRKHYAACVSFADAQVGKLLSRLDSLGLRDETIIVLWGDHGWHLGEHAIWGKHALFEESLLSPLIISAPGMKATGKPTRSMVETLDIYPTLCELTGLTRPQGIQGVSLSSILADPQSPGHVAVGYFGRAGRTLRTDTYRMILQEDGFVELYDHRLPDAETVNLAGANGPLVAAMTAQLEARLAGSDN